MFDYILVSDLKKIVNANVIDIRNNIKYNDGHILNAINIPFDKLIINPSKYLNKNIKYYIYCQKGNKSKVLCYNLKNQGYNVININGGYEAWILNE